MRDMGAKLASVTGFIAFLTFPAVAAAQNDEDQLKALRDCRTIQDDAARLACFDTAVQVVIARQDSGEITVVDKEDIRETRRGLFGFSMPKLGIFGSGDDEADQVMQSTITGLRQLRGDHWEIEIAEGSVWQATNTPRRFKPETGDSVELERAAMGSYWLRVDGSLGVKARRIR